MENLIAIVERAERHSRELAQDRERCQMEYAASSDGCYSERCGRRTAYACTECNLALCEGCMEPVSFEAYCQFCASEKEAEIRKLIAEDQMWEERR